MQGQLTENSRLLNIFTPQNISGSSFTSAWFALKWGSRARIVITTGAWVGSSTSAVTLNQAPTVSGASSVALAFTTYWTSTQTADQAVVQTATGNTFNLAAASTNYILEVNNYDLTINSNTQAPTDAYVQVALGSPGSNADYVAIIADVYDGQYAGKAFIMPSLVV